MHQYTEDRQQYVLSKVDYNCTYSFWWSGSSNSLPRKGVFLIVVGFGLLCTLYVCSSMGMLGRLTVWIRSWDGGLYVHSSYIVCVCDRGHHFQHTGYQTGIVVNPSWTDKENGIIIGMLDELYMRERLWIACASGTDSGLSNRLRTIT